MQKNRISLVWADTELQKFYEICWWPFWIVFMVTDWVNHVMWHFVVLSYILTKGPSHAIQQKTQKIMILVKLLLPCLALNMMTIALTLVTSGRLRQLKILHSLPKSCSWGEIGPRGVLSFTWAVFIHGNGFHDSH